MATVAVKPKLTPEDLLAMPDQKNYELVGGELVERNVSALSSWVGGRSYRLIADFAESQNLGMAWPSENGYQCFADDPRKVRKPDASFIKQERVPANWLEAGYLRIAPDLAVEVVSPNDLYSEVEEKVYEYLKAGVTLVWVVDPEVRVVRVHRADSTAAYLNENDELSGEVVLPGFRCPVRSLFPPPAVVAPDVTGR